MCVPEHDPETRAQVQIVHPRDHQKKTGQSDSGEASRKSGFLEQLPQREYGRRVFLWPPPNPQNLYLGVITGQREIKIADGIKTGDHLALRILEYPK